MTNPSQNAHFVESIPLGLEDLKGAAQAESTADALIRLTNAAKRTVDLTAMYWALLVDTSSGDDAGWDKEILEREFGADRGAALYRALDSAAERGIRIRILESPGFSTGPTESQRLQADHPDTIRRESINMEDWFGSGIMHQKIWVFDGRSVYIGSANMDWKSLTQVKELGIVVEDDPAVAAEVSRYFETWWTFASLPAGGNTATVFDPRDQIERLVPAWSPLVPPDQRTEDPLEASCGSAPSSWEAPMTWSANGEEGQLILSGAPAELCAGGRTFDGKLLVETILDARESVCISVMDWAPVSLFRDRTGDGPPTPVWWPDLIDAVLKVVLSKRVHARLLVSDWAHTSPFVDAFLGALGATASAAAASPHLVPGQLEIRRFRVPGFESTGPRRPGEPQPQYPGHTRVNHTKYIVTDRRINIGTSNMTWDYFRGTAGASFNANQPGLVHQLQGIFDRDWGSRYAHPVPLGPD